MRVWEKVIFIDTPIQTESKNKVYEDFAKEMGGYISLKNLTSTTQARLAVTKDTISR